MLTCPARTPKVISVFVKFSKPEERSTGSPPFAQGGLGQGLFPFGAGAMGPCQSKCEMPKRWPGWAGSGSGMISEASDETVPVPYFTSSPTIGSSVSNSMLTPGGELTTLGKVTETG